MECSVCHTEPKLRIQNRHFIECGLKNVVVKNARTTVCNCGSQIILEIGIWPLYVAILSELLKKPLPFSPEEIGFIRNMLVLKAVESDEFSKRIGFEFHGIIKCGALDHLLCPPRKFWSEIAPTECLSADDVLVNKMAFDDINESIAKSIGLESSAEFFEIGKGVKSFNADTERNLRDLAQTVVGGDKLESSSVFTADGSQTIFVRFPSEEELRRCPPWRQSHPRA